MTPTLKTGRFTAEGKWQDGDIDWSLLEGFLKSLRNNVPDRVYLRVVDGFEATLNKSGLSTADQKGWLR